MEVGDKLPSFSLKNQNNEIITQEKLVGKFSVIYFYPKDNTPGCTQEAIDFTEKREELQSLNVNVIGVSKDSTESHQKFINKYNINFDLLSDESLEFHKSMGAFGEKISFGKKTLGTIRSTFIVDKELNILKTYYNVSVKGHVEAVIKYLKSL